MIYTLSLTGDREKIICTVILPGDISTQFDRFVVIGDESNAFLVNLESR